jgi:hypothetical protein
LSSAAIIDLMAEKRVKDKLKNTARKSFGLSRFV